MAIPCQRRLSGVECGDKARLFVAAYGGKSWSGYYCEKHGPSIIKLRMRLIKKYKQSVVLRYITDWDRKQWKQKQRMSK